MKNSIDRREFIKRCAAAGAATAAGSFLLPSSGWGSILPEKINLAVLHGTAYFQNTIKAVELLGGIQTFVKKDSTVGLLINSPWNKPGTYTHPDVALAVLTMCLDAGAKEIVSIEGASANYWKRSNLYDKYKKEIGRIQTRDSKKTIQIPKGKSLTEAEISAAFLECDTLINIPIAKDHQGTNFTCVLKNTMGACSHSTNRFFHSGPGGQGFYDHPDFLSQCIADVNLIRKPDLCVVDATEFITTNGPAGPGEIKKAHKIIAGTDCVSVDAYCAALLGLVPKDVSMIRSAHEHGIGEIDLKLLTVKELSTLRTK